MSFAVLTSQEGRRKLDIELNSTQIGNRVKYKLTFLEYLPAPEWSLVDRRARNSWNTTRARSKQKESRVRIITRSASPDVSPFTQGVGGRFQSPFFCINHSKHFCRDQIFVWKHSHSKYVICKRGILTYVRAVHDVFYFIEWNESGKWLCNSE